MKKTVLITFVFLLAACSKPAEIHTDIYTKNTTESVSDIMPTECVVDTDCTLHDSNYGWGCCYAGACDALDYSQDRWIAVNKGWIGQEKNKWCLDECGPMPGCPTRVVNVDYQAVCTSGTCIKVKTE